MEYEIARLEHSMARLSIEAEDARADERRDIAQQMFVVAASGMMFECLRETDTPEARRRLVDWCASFVRENAKQARQPEVSTS